MRDRETVRRSESDEDRESMQFVRTDISPDAKRRRRRTAPFDLGWLGDDPPTLAARIADACAYGMMTVWIDDECRVHGLRTEAHSLPMHWIVGTYTCGVSLQDVVEDLCHERLERERIGLIA